MLADPRVWSVGRSVRDMPPVKFPTETGEFTPSGDVMCLADRAQTTIFPGCACSNEWQQKFGFVDPQFLLWVTVLAAARTALAIAPSKGSRIVRPKDLSHPSWQIDGDGALRSSGFQAQNISITLPGLAMGLSRGVRARSRIQFPGLDCASSLPVSLRTRRLSCAGFEHCGRTES